MADVVARQYTPAFVFLYPQSATVENTISVLVPVSRLELELSLGTPSVFNEAHSVALIEGHPSLTIVAHQPAVSIVLVTSIEVPRRFQRSAWQARLGAKLDPIKRKFRDNSMLLAAHPTDMLRIRVLRDPRTHDILSRKIVSNEILPIILPVMEDVPMRRLVREDHNILSLSITDVDNAKPFEVYCPSVSQLQRDDLLFRFIGDPYSESPYVLVLQVKDELGTIGYSELLHVKYSVTIYDEALPSAVVSAVYAAAIKRGRLKW